MVKARGSGYRRDRLKGLPFVVEARQPRGGGLGQRLNHMVAWCDEHIGRDGYATSFREDRDTAPGMLPIEFVLWHFADEQAAKDFAAHFWLTYPAAVSDPHNPHI
jgi:hypothetical protein